MESSEPERRPQPNARAVRREPSLGPFAALQFRSAERTAGAGERTPLWRWLVVVVVLVAVVLLLARQPLATWLWPQTQAEQLRERAGRALAAGRLTAADGTGARELYEAALALDPDRSDARDGLNRVGEAALGQARAALAHRDYPRAHQALDLARALSIPQAQITAVREQLRRSEAASAGIDNLLAEAAAARAAGRLDGEGAYALPLYQRVLELQPGLTVALEGREDTLADLLQQARKELLAGDLADAADIVHRVQSADAGHVDLPDALAALTRAADTARRQADRDLRDHRLARAAEGYRNVLAIDPDDAPARSGMTALIEANAQRSEELAADFRFQEAQQALAQAQILAKETGVETAAIREAQQHLQRARQSQRQMATTLPAGQREARLKRLLADAAQAQARGDLLTPPGDSAFDKLRAARAIAPDDPRVKAAAAHLLPAANTCFADALRANRLVRAGACLDARRALEGTSRRVRDDGRELAQRWVAMGDQRLSAGEIAGAQGAIAAARALDPRAPGLAELSQRLKAATPGRP